MPGRGPVNPVPIEHRGWSTRRRREVLTTGDRLICAGMGAAMGLALWSIFYAILFLLSFRVAMKAGVAADLAADPVGLLPSCRWWGAATADGFALFGFLVGPERMMDGFERVLGWLGLFARKASHHD